MKQEERFMAEVQSFRTALNGFNRQDVVRYIEYLNNKHAAEVEQLNTQLSTAREAVANATDPALKRQLEVEKAKNEVLEKTIAELQTALAQKDPAGNLNAEELEAYRRAERMEREAQQRAGQIHAQVDAILADAALRVKESTARVSTMADQAAAQLQQCQEAIAATKAAFEEASSAIAAIGAEETHA